VQGLRCLREQNALLCGTCCGRSASFACLQGGAVLSLLLCKQVMLVYETETARYQEITAFVRLCSTKLSVSGTSSSWTTPV
jgi:hypothetical protein